MLFNSHIFMLLFLPLLLAGWYFLNWKKKFQLAQGYLIGMSLWFYAYANLQYLWLLLFSCLIGWLLSCLPEKIFSEKMTGRQQNRPELDACMNFLREGDTLVVYKLDRLGRSLKNILTLLEDFKNRGILFTSLQDNISTEGAIGQLMNNILGAFAQFERDLIHERTQEGRRIAKEKGVKFGRKTLINKNNIAKQKSCIQLYESGTPVREIQKILNIGSSGTVYRLLRRNGIALKSESKSE